MSWWLTALVMAFVLAYFTGLTIGQSLQPEPQPHNDIIWTPVQP